MNAWCTFLLRAFAAIHGCVSHVSITSDLPGKNGTLNIEQGWQTGRKVILTPSHSYFICRMAKSGVNILVKIRYFFPHHLLVYFSFFWYLFISPTSGRVGIGQNIYPWARYHGRYGMMLLWLLFEWLKIDIGWCDCTREISWFEISPTIRPLSPSQQVVLTYHQ